MSMSTMTAGIAARVGNSSSGGDVNMDSIGLPSFATAGTKRKSDDLADSERFTKRFNLLTLGLDSRLQNPAPPLKRSPRKKKLVSTASKKPYGDSDNHMQVDSTRNRVYIHDLDDELSSSDSDADSSPRLIFLPDIEKQLSRIPPQVLHAGSGQEHGSQTASDSQLPHDEPGTFSGPPSNQSLVLYDTSQEQAPSTHDSVRRAIVDARQRAREKVAAREHQREMDMLYQYGTAEASVETAHGYTAGYEDGDRAGAERQSDIYGDAMDVD